MEYQVNDIGGIMEAVEYVENGEVVGDNFDEYIEHMYGPVELIGIRETGGPFENKVAIMDIGAEEYVYRPFTSTEVPSDR